MRKACMTFLMMESAKKSDGGLKEVSILVEKT